MCLLLMMLILENEGKVQTENAELDTAQSDIISPLCAPVLD